MVIDHWSVISSKPFYHNLQQHQIHHGSNPGHHDFNADDFDRLRLSSKYFELIGNTLDPFLAVQNLVIPVNLVNLVIMVILVILVIMVIC